MTEPRIVDTNVGIIANDNIGDSIRPPECIRACAGFIANLMASGRIVLDFGWEIISEYKHCMRSPGEPGVGDAFLKWVLTNHANPDRCHKVNINEVVVPMELTDFDADDHKFIKTAVASPDAQVAQAADSLWWKRRADFDRANIAVYFLCPNYIKSLSDRKHGPDANGKTLGYWATAITGQLPPYAQT